MAYHVLNHFKNGLILEDLEHEIQWDETIIPRSLVAPQPARTDITPDLQTDPPRIAAKYKGKEKEGTAPRLNDSAEDLHVEAVTPTVPPTNVSNPTLSEFPAPAEDSVVLATKRKRIASQKSKAVIDESDEESSDASPQPEAKKVRVGRPTELSGNKARKGMMEERPPPEPVVGQYWLDVEEIVIGGSCKMCMKKGWTCKVTYTKPSEQPEIKRDPTDIRERPYRRASCHQCHSHKVSCDWSNSPFEPSVGPEGVYNNAPPAFDEQEQARVARAFLLNRKSGQALKRGPGRPRKNPVTVQAPISEAPELNIETPGPVFDLSPADRQISSVRSVQGLQHNRPGAQTTIEAGPSEVHATSEPRLDVLRNVFLLFYFQNLINLQITTRK